LFQLIPSDTHFDFLGKRRVAAALSLALIAVGVAAIPLRGIRTGIDFSGGTEIQLAFEKDAGVDEGRVREALGASALAGADVIRFGGGDSSDFLVRFAGELPAPEDAPAQPEKPEQAAPGDSEGELSPEVRQERMAALEKTLEEKLGPVEVERVEFVGPRVGAELRRDGLMALVFSWLVILGYVGFRFSLRYGPGAVVALIHDVLVTAAVWVLLGLEFDLQVLAALLTIIGFSVNDTIVVFDRVRENLALRTRRELEEVVNRSINETLSRTLLTSGTVFLSCLALVIAGGPVIRPFALAMTIGVVAGTYSTVYIAAPVMIWLEERFGGAAAAAGPAAAKSAKGAKPAKI
jgi:preprotein translocase subunit SecF